MNPVNDTPETATATLTANEVDGVFEIDLRDYISDPDSGEVLSTQFSYTVSDDTGAATQASLQAKVFPYSGFNGYPMLSARFFRGQLECEIGSFRIWDHSNPRAARQRYYRH